jgi:hypothetical protein
VGDKTEIFNLIIDDARRTSTLRANLAKRRIELINTYRHGPYKIVALMRWKTNVYLDVTAQASHDVGWTQEALNEWLREELIR